MSHSHTVPKLVIHGGIFTHLKVLTEHHLEQRLHEALAYIVKQSYDVLCAIGARAAVLHAVRCLEDEILFNAGTGSLLQADGQVRMSAALMDSTTQNFSGVINIQNVKNPIEIAQLLSKGQYLVLAGEKAGDYAKQQGIPFYNPIIPRRQIWYEKYCLSKNGTVGAVAIDKKGTICAGTSTGGLGCELPGRVSDSATIAGTYASSQAGISCTGIGEHIVNHGVAVKIATRVQDGLTIQEAVEKTLQEARTLNYRFGLISLDHHSHIVIGKTIEEEDYSIVYARYDGQVLKAFP